MYEFNGLDYWTGVSSAHKVLAMFMNMSGTFTLIDGGQTLRVLGTAGVWGPSGGSGVAPTEGERARQRDIAVLQKVQTLGSGDYYYSEGESLTEGVSGIRDCRRAPFNIHLFRAYPAGHAPIQLGCSRSPKQVFTYRYKCADSVHQYNSYVHADRRVSLFRSL